MLERAVDAFWQIAPARRASRLTLVKCRVTGQLDVSLLIAGPADGLRAVTGLALRAPDGSLCTVDTAKDVAGNHLRLAATLPEAHFDGGACHELVLRTDRQPLALKVPDRTVIQHRLSISALQRRAWPVHVTVLRGSLRVQGTAPEHHTIDHAVMTTRSSVAVSWVPGEEPAACLIFTCREDLTTVAVDAIDRDGRWEAHLDPVVLVHPSSDWDMHVSRNEGFAPLLRQLGEFPRLGRAAVFRELSVLTPTDGLARLRFYYTGGNRLAVRVRPVGAVSR